MSKETNEEVERLARILHQHAPDISSDISLTVDSNNHSPAPRTSAITKPLDDRRFLNSVEVDLDTSSIATAQLETVSKILESVVKVCAKYTLIPRSVIWGVIRQGVVAGVQTDVGDDAIAYMDAIEKSEQKEGIGRKSGEDLAVLVEDLKAQLEAEKRSHKILKRDIVAIESNYVDALARIREDDECIRGLENQVSSQTAVLEEMEVRMAALQNELRISNEMVERGRKEYRLLNETFEKVNESNQRNISHLKSSLGLSSLGPTSTHARSASSLINQTFETQMTSVESTNMIQQLQAELKYTKDRYEADTAAFKKLNEELQLQLSKSLSNYEALVAEGRTEEEWAAIQKTVRLLEIKNREASQRVSGAVDTLETTAHKYTILAENYEQLKLDMKRAKDNSNRLKSILQAKDAIIDDLHHKTSTILADNDALKTKLKNTLATVTIKTNMVTDWKTKFDALLSKVDPIRKEAEESEALREVNKRLLHECRNKDLVVQELKRKYSDMETTIKQLASNTNSESQLKQELEGAYKEKVYKLQKSLTLAESRLGKLETAIRKSLQQVFAMRERRGRSIDEFGVLSGGQEEGNGNVGMTPELAVKMSRLSKEFFGMGLYDVIKGPIPSKEDFAHQLKEALQPTDIEKKLPKLVTELCCSL
ncbi:hypothetical protein HDU79_002184 [Rhizoclosmatium sp. JEL0117]|nr:hypothetical protein HDU79_002184 [Rhizoclosmatium sp. JEL0117]